MVRFSSCHPTKNKKNFVLFGSFRFVPSRSAFVFLCPPFFFPAAHHKRGDNPARHVTYATLQPASPAVCVCVLFRRVFYTHTHTHPHPFCVSSAREKFKLQLASLRRWGVSSIQQQQLHTRYSTMFLCAAYTYVHVRLLFIFFIRHVTGFSSNATGQEAIRSLPHFYFCFLKFWRRKFEFRSAEILTSSGRLF